MLLDGARRPGAKLLVSGGGRCNVTNARVTERDFHGGSRAAIRQVLRSMPIERTVAFFEDLGVPLHEEAGGKLFPDSNRARDVLDALLDGCARLGVERLDGHRVTAIASSGGSGFTLETTGGGVAAGRVVLATGGQSLPKSGSDGHGWAMARSLGHTIVPPVPALVPLLLDPQSLLPFASLSGVSHEVDIAVWIEGRQAERVAGSLLWTHFGISGPAALDVSRHWTRAIDGHREVQLTLNTCPGQSFETLERLLVQAASDRPRASLVTILGQWLPTAVAEAFVVEAGTVASQPIGTLDREVRRRLVHALVAWPLPIVGTRGYNYAEVTAGGVDLSEVSPKTMESRICAGLYLVGEVLDVDGRLGGFNFQWAWASAATAARGLGRAPLGHGVVNREQQ